MALINADDDFYNEYTLFAPVWVKKTLTHILPYLLLLQALRGAAQIIELAIETLKKELPPAPPSVKELRRAESASKQSVVSQGRLEGIKNRGKPKSEEDSSVGRM